MAHIIEIIKSHMLYVQIALVVILVLLFIFNKKWPDLKLVIFCWSCSRLARTESSRNQWKMKLNNISTRRKLEEIRRKSEASQAEILQNEIMEKIQAEETLKAQQIKDAEEAEKLKLKEAADLEAQRLKEIAAQKAVDARERKVLAASIKKANRRRFKSHFGFFPEEMKRLVFVPEAGKKKKLIKMSFMREVHAKFLIVGKEACRIACMKPSRDQQSQYNIKAAEYADMMALAEEFISDYAAPHWSELQQKLKEMKELAQFAEEKPPTKPKAKSSKKAPKKN